MKYYVVKMPAGDWNNIFIVKANNEKDSINKVFKRVFEPDNEKLKEENKECGYNCNHIYSRKDLESKELEKYFTEESNMYGDEILCLN